MNLHGPALAAGVVLQFSPGGIKSVPDGHVDVVVGGILARFACLRQLHLWRFLTMLGWVCDPFWLMLDYKLTARQGQVDAHMIELSLAVVPVRRLDHHSATHYIVVKEIQLGRLLADISLNSLGRSHVAKRNLKWELNSWFPPLRNAHSCLGTFHANKLMEPSAEKS